MIVVGEHHDGEGYRYLRVPDMMRNTNDALVKRDVGTVATDADILVYLSDDHALLNPPQEPQNSGTWATRLRYSTQLTDVFIPMRFADHPARGRIRIPNGEENITDLYCAGHGGAFRRNVVMARPWASMPHHRNWDLLASRMQREAGYRLAPCGNLSILDLEPEACPWQ